MNSPFFSLLHRSFRDVIGPQSQRTSIRLALLSAVIVAAPVATAGTFQVRKAIDSNYAYNTRGLVLASDGRLYGLSKNGGTSNEGAIFSLSPNGTNFTIVHSFSAATEGNAPNGYLTEFAGKLYGLTSAGGAHGLGTLFAYAPLGLFSAHSFTTAEGGTPLGSLVYANGKLYGTTTSDGAQGHGTVFSAAPVSLAVTVLHDFSTLENGTGSTPMLAADGKLYGTSSNAVFSITNTDIYTPLLTLTSDQGASLGDLTQDPLSGQLFGFAATGGHSGLGTIFSLTTSSGSPVTVLHHFSGTEGSAPVGGPLLFRGRLFGASNQGGDKGDGTLFSCDTTDGGSFAVEHTFDYPAEGGYSWGRLIVASGLIYGSTATGGTAASGSVFSYDPNDAPHAQFFIFPNPATVGTNILFNGAFSSDPNQGDQIVNYAWNVGDGTPVLSGGGYGYITHTYHVAGVFDVSLTVTDTYGATNTTSFSLTVTKVSQAINFPPLGNKYFGAPPSTLIATTTSGLTPTFYLLYGPATIQGNTITFTGTGSGRVRASQPGNGLYAAAPDVEQAFTVSASVAGDFDADGQQDIVFENRTTGARYLWLMHGTAYAAGVDLGTLPTVWQLVAVADFNHDGRPDLLFENTVTGDRYVWLMNGTVFSSGVDLGVVSTNWHIAGAADFNNDGKPDILWENTVTGDRYVWLMNGTTFNSGVSLGNVATAFRIVDAVDFNGDGQTDIVWENTATGKRVLWLMNGTTFTSSVSLGIVSVDYHIVTAADFNGDSQPDILFENTVTGDRYLWLMNGTAYSSGVDLGVVSTDWHIAN